MIFAISALRSARVTPLVASPVVASTVQDRQDVGVGGASSSGADLAADSGRCPRRRPDSVE